MSEHAMRPRSDLRLYGRMVFDSRRYWPHILGVFFLDLLSMPIALLTPVPVALVIDTVLGDRPPGGPLTGLGDAEVLLIATLSVVLIAILSQAQSLASSLMTTYTGERVTLDFRARLFRHLQRLSFAWHDKTGSGDSLYRIQYDSPSIAQVAVKGVTPFITAAVTLGAMVLVMSRISLQLAIIALAIAPVVFLLVRRSRAASKPRWRQLKRLESSSMSVVEEVLGNLRVVKGFGQEDREQQRFVDASSSTLATRIRVSAIEGVTGAGVTVTMAVGTALVLFVGALSVQNGVMTVGELTLVIGYMSQLYSPLKSLSSSITTLQSSLASGERAYAVLEEVPDVQEKHNAIPLPRAKGDIRFEGVFFGYRPDQLVLYNVDLAVPAGMRVGIQGRTGSGKTTFISLLMRFYDPRYGRILLDGVDLRDYRIEDLRSQFAVVLQEPVLFSRSIAENIAYARPEASMSEIIAAARAANAHDFILSMPDGYETSVGDRGMSLSGGERQRISLARAFLKDAPMLVLDEPTSSVDTETETLIVDAMDRLMKGRTTFMIAHRLGTLASCDMRVEMIQGRAVIMRAEQRHAGRIPVHVATSVPGQTRPWGAG
jgi:ATP-binding cassette subfamily B protein